MEKAKTSLRYMHIDNYWQWWVSNEKDVYYCTDDDGEGVFRIDQRRNNRDQLTGTLQFSVRGLSEEYAKRKIKAFMRDRMWGLGYED